MENNKSMHTKSTKLPTIHNTKPKGVLQKDRLKI